MIRSASPLADLRNTLNSQGDVQRPRVPLVPERDAAARYFFQIAKVVGPTRFRQSLTASYTSALTVALRMPYYEPDAPASEWIVDARREQKGVRVAMATVGEFVRDVGGREIRPPACPILPRPRTIGRPREFANSISNGTENRRKPASFLDSQRAGGPVRPQTSMGGAGRPGRKERGLSRSRHKPRVG